MLLSMSNNRCRGPDVGSEADRKVMLFLWSGCGCCVFGRSRVRRRAAVVGERTLGVLADSVRVERGFGSWDG